MTCKACESASHACSGLYNFSCLKCCVRLVLSAHPNKRHATTMLAAINRFRDAPARQDILEAVKQELNKGEQT